MFCSKGSPFQTPLALVSFSGLPFCFASKAFSELPIRFWPLLPYVHCHIGYMSLTGNNSDSTYHDKGAFQNHHHWRTFCPAAFPWLTTGMKEKHGSGLLWCGRWLWCNSSWGWWHWWACTWCELCAPGRWRAPLSGGGPTNSSFPLQRVELKPTSEVISWEQWPVLGFCVQFNVLLIKVEAGF